MLNRAGREVPDELNGIKFRPYAGDLKTLPEGRKAGPKIRIDRGEKVITLKEAVNGLEDGACISFHHHLRNGDGVVNMVMQEVKKIGLKKLILAPSALFPVHAEVIVPLLKDGTVRRIEGSMNGPIGDACSHGEIEDVAILRSHSGRVNGIESGKMHIDLACIAAPCSDKCGNLNGIHGASACGPLSYSTADAEFGDRVIGITDNLVPYPAHPISISQDRVDGVVKVQQIGDPEGIASGTLRITRSPTRLKIVKYAVGLIEKVALKDGFSFQTGAGGISLAITKLLGEIMEKRKVKASFVSGGITGYAVELLHKGLVDVLIDLQAFDLAAIKSLREDADHIEAPISQYGNPHACGGLVNMLDVGVLGGTEVDIDFNVNVNTHSDGLLLHGIGGHQEVAAGSKLTIVTIPLYRYRIPTIRERVTTITTPGEYIDVIATEYGIAVNPKRKDIIDRLKGSEIPISSIEELQRKAYSICGRPEDPKITDEIVAGILWRDGTLLDVVYKVR